MVIDSHTHMPSPEWGKHECSYCSVKATVEHLQQAGIDRAIFNTWQGVFAETEDDINIANAEALKLHKEFGGFLYPGTVIHPAFPETSKEWLDQFRNEGLLWVGELVQYKCGMEFNEVSWLKLFEYCAGRGHLVQLHNSKSIVDVAAKFPEMQIVCAHINLPLLDALAQKENIWQDISGRCGGFTEGALETTVKIFGADRLLFGTDFTGYEPQAFIDRVNSAIKSVEDKEKIYSENIIKLLAKAGSLPIC
jgi:predicted TIM-barrel fold metal-dependent hydrolase